MLLNDFDETYSLLMTRLDDKRVSEKESGSACRSKGVNHVSNVAIKKAAFSSCFQRLQCPIFGALDLKIYMILALNPRCFCT